MSILQVYEAPKGAAGRNDYRVKVRIPGESWQELFVYEVKVDMHQVRQASMVYFDMEGQVEVRIEGCQAVVSKVVIRPLAADIPFREEDNAVSFMLEKPCKLSIEMDGDRFSNLHLFANPMEENAPQPADDGVLVLNPAIHRTEDIYRLAAQPVKPGGEAPKVIYFAPGMHYLEETILRIPSGTTVYLAGGAVIVGSLLCDRAHDVTIRGRGILYLSDFHRFSAFRGIRLVFSRNIDIEGIITLDPPHYSIYIGKSEHIRIRNFKSFSTRGWSDGIDMMASSHIEIDDVFLRTSDDCIAIYGSRWDYRGGTRDIAVSNSILWADVAHPMMIGTHGDHHHEGDVIEDIRFHNIDVLEHHEPQPNYWGAMAINAGDKNTVRNVSYEQIRLEDFELGQVVDIRVVRNKDYNPAPGQRIENITFRDVSYRGSRSRISRIHGFDQERPVQGIQFINFRINGEPVLAPQGHFDINEFAWGIDFREE
ncbi:Glycosyl hydrolases family 28 [Paenibacillus sp. UNCCL117]|uniref:glycosyl hydrolase family 28 protein n=1 Tax=unclassified Paenibacillus TaxID=185978 RepID=UPI00087F393F|nr:MULTISPECIES: glycosyl hydrolase family 28 protein [unclassified Paenibacillus]SDD06761.1 Glycosyl hydrolases family 28 [Paenibacillus sp. cl123]SFW31626.1 Glycosyl hydrolases family 28 [Paenibacillus sp. UNCCL117]